MMVSEWIKMTLTLNEFMLECSSRVMDYCDVRCLDALLLCVCDAFHYGLLCMILIVLGNCLNEHAWLLVWHG